jgi:uncharacterized protein YgbK (DUF1537 family)
VYTLLMLADDLTGALDTGVQFAKRGIPTWICPSWQGGKDHAPGTGIFPVPAEGALVINTGTRHRSPAEARGIIGGILEQYPAVPYIYKKTDSTLRGHIGAELEALVLARNLRILPFIPAYPRLGRITRRGRQYLKGVPIDKTAAAADALNPVRRSFIPAIIAEESELPVRLVPCYNRSPGEDSILPGADQAGTDEPGAALKPLSLPGRAPAAEGPEIWVYDAETNADLGDIAGGLEKRGLLGTTAGCAGFAEFLVDFIPFTGAADEWEAALEKLPGADQAGADKPGAALKPVLMPGREADRRPVLIVSGSRHPVSLAQVRAARAANIPALAVGGDKFSRPGWLEGKEAASIISRCGELLRARGCCILGTRLSLGRKPAMPEGEERPVSKTGEETGDLAGHLGRMAGKILKLSGPAHLTVFGGDTLLGILEALDCRLLRPLREIRPGVVLARAESPGENFSIAAKSGAFGEPGLIAELVDFFRPGEPS